MRYTPEELLDWAKEQGMQIDLITLLANNDKGFAYVPAEGKLTRKDGKTCFLSTSPFENEIMLDDDGKSTPDEVIETEEIKFYIVKIAEDDWRVLMVPFLTQEEKEAFKDAPKMFEKTHDELCKMFFACCGINTHGKLRVAIERAKECMRSYNEFTTKHNIMPF